MYVQMSTKRLSGLRGCCGGGARPTLGITPAELSARFGVPAVVPTQTSTVSENSIPYVPVPTFDAPPPAQPGAFDEFKSWLGKRIGKDTSITNGHLVAGASTLLLVAAVAGGHRR